MNARRRHERISDFKDFRIVPRVSLGLPVYNGERYLSQSIGSILAQTFTDFELIVSDNGSTDGTKEICRHFAAGDSRVRLFEHPANRGAVFNCNYVLSQATAPYFKWVHADDVHAPRHLERCVLELDAAPAHVALVYPRTIIIDENGAQLKYYDDGLDLRQPRAADRLRLLIRRLELCNVIFGLMRTSVLRACRPLGTYPHADHALLHELSLRGEFREIPEYLFLRRIHPEKSHRADQTVNEIAIWLDPRNRGRLFVPHFQMLVHTLSAIGAAQLAPSEDLRCRAVAFYEWLFRYSRVTAREVMQALGVWIRRERGDLDPTRSARHRQSVQRSGNTGA